VKHMPNYDLTYLTIDSLSEGVGSSQITPLIRKLSLEGLKIRLISFEKFLPSTELQDSLITSGVDWTYRPFGHRGIFGGTSRLIDMRRLILPTNLIHARSDIPTAAAISKGHDKVLWDVRSLWADQKVIINDSYVDKTLYKVYRKLEDFSANNSLGMSTLTKAVVPILEARNRALPKFRTVVATSVDTDLFVNQKNPPETFKALFSGTYNKFYDLEISRLFMDRLRKRISVETHWARPFESETNHLEVGETKVFLSTQKDMADLIPLYNFGISICKIDSGPSLKASMPTKIAEFLACGRPIVVNRGLGDMDELIDKFDIGVIIDGNLNSLDESVDKLIELISDKNTSDRCRFVAENYFSMDNGVRNYLDIYSRMLNN